MHQQGPRNWLRQAAGAAAPSRGRALHKVSNRGGHITREKISPCKNPRPFASICSQKLSTTLTCAPRKLPWKRQISK
ncbi:hypothetical protein B0B52_08525 [Polaromonas sp. A23]|nr:hypothetical protein B0B52_08525 [Polaromonas sp. A23]